MLIAKIFQSIAGQPSFQQISLPVSPKRHSPVSVITLDRPFFQPARSVSQTSSQSVSSSSQMPVAQGTGMVSQPGSQKPVTFVDFHQHPATSSNEMSVFRNLLHLCYNINSNYVYFPPFGCRNYLCR